MIWDAEKSGKLTKDKVIVEPTSGNTGIALAFTAASRGYKLILTMPESMSLERRRVMAVLGAELVLTEAAKGMPGAIAKAKEIADSDPGKYFMPGQFDNPANPDIHFKTTGPEIWNDCDGAIDVLVAGVGTGGTITGVSRYIKNEAGKAIESVAVEPSHSPVITQTINGETVKPGPHKIQGIGAGFIPKNLDMSMVDKVEQVTNDESIAMALRLAQEEGLLVGISCGAAAAGCHPPGGTGRLRRQNHRGGAARPGRALPLFSDVRRCAHWHHRAAGRRLRRRTKATLNGPVATRGFLLP